MEQILLGTITSQLWHKTWASQNGSTRGQWCLTNLNTFGDKATHWVSAGLAVDIAYLDFSKALDKVSHSLLLERLDTSQPRQMICGVGVELAARPYSEGGSQWFLLNLAARHKWGPPRDRH